MTILSHQALDPSELLREVADPALGGTAMFVGTVRDVHRDRAVTGLDYSCYPAMVEAEGTTLLADAANRFGARVAVRHRVGSLEVGDVAVVVVAAAPHRDAAFAAARWTIDEVKRRLPIWKHEHFVDGTSEWVNPAAEERVTP
jgi:molybdopterin synthase catalytic subunit